MLISPEHGFVFVHIPKTAGTSVSTALMGWSNFVKPGPWVKLRRRLPGRLPPVSNRFGIHASAAEARARLGAEVWDGFLSFAFVRNPYAHAWSHYQHMRRYRHRALARHVQGMDFATYLDWRLAGARRRHWRYVERFAYLGDQAGFVVDAAGAVLVDRLCRFEALGADLAALLAELGLPAVDLPHILDSGRPLTPEAAAAFSPAAVATIERLYARDFALFGYATARAAGGVAASLARVPPPPLEKPRQTRRFPLAPPSSND